jgi:hypothetical protein
LRQHVFPERNLADGSNTCCNLAGSEMNPNAQLAERNEPRAGLGHCEKQTHAGLPKCNKACRRLSDCNYTYSHSANGYEPFGDNALSGFGTFSSREVQKWHPKEGSVAAEFSKIFACRVQEPAPDSARRLFNLVFDLLQQLVLHNPLFGAQLSSL